MLRLLALTFVLVCGLAQADPATLYRTIDLDTGHGVLHGSLMLPQRNHPVPVALIIPGSGPTNRDGNNPGARNNNLLLLAEQLARRGIASVRYDKRGVAESRAAAPDERDLSLNGYVDDAAAWVGQLADDPRFANVVIIGHSEGALVGTLAAERGSVAGLVTLAGSGRPIGQVLDEQLRTRLPPTLLRPALSILGHLERGEQVADVPKDLQVVFRPSVQPYLISLMQVDPARALARVKIPTLIVQGTHDIQVGVADAERLQAARPDAQLKLIGGMNHVLRIVPQDYAAQVTSYSQPQLPLAAELVPAVSSFIESLQSRM